MATRFRHPQPSLDIALAEAFRRNADLPGVSRVKVTDHRLWAYFPESDFVIQTKPGSDDGEVTLTFSISVRAPEPSLETWAGSWSTAADRRNQAEVVRHEVLTARDSVLRMLAERFAGEQRDESRLALVGD